MKNQSNALSRIAVLAVYIGCSIVTFSQDSSTSNTNSQTDSLTAAAVQGVPRLVKFSGSLKDSDGRPLVGHVQMTFAIFTEQEGGSPVWQETRSVNLDILGRYTVLLGSTGPEGLPIELFAGDDAHWIGVVAEGSQDQPRTLLVSVPYALKAADADTLGGKPLSAFILADTAASATTSMNKSLRLSDGTAAKRESTGNFNTTTVNPFPNFLAKFDANTSIINSGVIEDNSGNVGIGTGTPVSKLDVGSAGGDISLGYNFQGISQLLKPFSTPHSLANVPSQINVGLSDGSFTGLNIKDVRDGSFNSASIEFATHHGGISAGTRMVIDKDGRVGIGTVNPITTLDVGSSTGGDIAFGYNYQGASKFLKSFGAAHAPSNVPSQLSMGLFDGSFTGVNVNDVRDGSFNSASIEFATHHGGISAGTRMVIDKDGNVGVGTLSPSARVDVSQNAAGSGSFTIGAPPPSAIHGDAPTNNGFISGVFGTTSSVDGFGVLGENLASGVGSGHSAGVRGITANTVNLGTGVWGDALQTSGDNVGVFGHSASNTGTGVQGLADSATGDAIGVYGRSDSTGGTGVFGEVTAGTAASATLFPAGVYGKIASNAGAAGLFDTVNSAGNILVGRVGGSPVNVFRVDGSGKVFANGGTATSGADFAESVAVKDERLDYEAADIIAIDPTGTRRFTKVNKPYSTLVAGIYSTKPGVLATPHAADDPRHETEEIPLAIVGIVPCKVSSENGQISVGDLLVSSSTPGYAMKGTDRNRMVGAIVGKALESMATSTGVIEVLVSLQ